MAVHGDQSELLKGSAINLFYNGEIITWSTNHTLQSTVNLNEVAVKDAGDYPLQIATSLSWNISAEFLYADTNVDLLMKAHKEKTPIDVTFAEVKEYSPTDEQGIIGKDTSSWSAGKVLAAGKVIVNDLSINSQAGDQATISCTLTGTGAYTSDADEEGTQGAQGAQGNQGN